MRLRARATLFQVLVLSGVMCFVVLFLPLSAEARHAASVSSAAGVSFDGNWETGDIDQWTWSAQCANLGDSTTRDRPERGTLTVVTAPVAQGNFAARFDLPAYPGRNACEALRKRTLALGTDDYYATAFRFPVGWGVPSSAGWGVAITQMNFAGIWGAPLALVAHRNRVELVVQTGACRDEASARPGCTYSSGLGGNLRPLLAIPKPLRFDRWHQLIVHVRWATDSFGVVEVWHRLKGESRWKRTAGLRGYPTVQWSAQRPAESDMVTSDKVGAYRGAASFPLVLWNDAFCIAGSFGAAATCFR